MIGIFDSGLGGLVVLKEIQKQLPQIPTIYLGDLANLPYGNKSAKIIQKLALKNTKFLLKKGAKIIVIACNSASATALPSLKKYFSKVPIFNVISPAVEKAVLSSKNKKIGVIGTKATIQSLIYNQKIKQSASRRIKVFNQSCPLLVPLVEEGYHNSKITALILRQYLKPLKAKNIDTLILGCTHYPLLKNQIQKIVGQNVNIIDSAQPLAKELKKFIKRTNFKFASQKNQYFVTDFSPGIKQIAQNFSFSKIKFNKINLS